MTKGELLITANSSRGLKEKQYRLPLNYCLSVPLQLSVIVVMDDRKTVGKIKHKSLPLCAELLIYASSNLKPLISIFPLF